MFYQIDHLNADEQEAFESTYAAVLAAEESGALDNATLDRVDGLLAIAAAADAGYAMDTIQTAWEYMS